MKRSPPSSEAASACSIPVIDSSGQSPPPEAKSELMAALKASGSLVAVAGPTEGSLNGARTYFDGSSSVSRRALTIPVAAAFTWLMMGPMLPVVSMAMARVGPTPSNCLICRSVTSALISRMNFLVASRATDTAALCRLWCGEKAQSVESLLMPKPNSPVAEPSRMPPWLHLKGPGLTRSSPE